MTTVVYFSHDEVGAPTLNNAVGSLVALLDACLIDGFNNKTVTSLVVAGGVATATISAHGHLTGRIVEFSGAGPSALNGRKKITVTGPNTITFAAAGVPDQTATGTITAKRPGLGWTKLFGDVGKAIYKRNDPQATSMLLRIDDTNANPYWARALMLESATGIDAFTNRSPTVAQITDGQYWTKGENNSTPKPWVLIGDSRTFYLFCDQNNWPFSSYGGLHFHLFGDITSFRAGDAYGCAIAGANDTSLSAVAPRSYNTGESSGQPAGFSLARAADTISLSPGGNFAACGNGLMGGYGPVFPSPIDNGLVILPRVLVTEHNGGFGNPIRGTARGMVAPLANIGNRMHKRLVPNLVGLDREVLLVSTMNQTSVGCVGFDITGPWN